MLAGQTEPRGPNGEDWIFRAMRRWYGLLGRHRILLAGLLVLGGVAFSLESRRIRWETDILAFFSGDSKAAADMAATASQPGFVNQMRLSVSLGDAPADVVRLHAVVDALGARLRATREFTAVRTGPSQDRAMASYAQMAAQAPLLLSEADLGTLEKRITPDYLNGQFAGVVSTLADPDGEIRANRFRADPLDAIGLVAARIKSMSPAQDAAMEDGLLLSADRAHAMIVAEPSARPTDTDAAARMLAAMNLAIDQTRREFPAMAAAVIGAHRNYVENAQRVKRDVTWISLAGSVAVALAIGIYFRRFGAVVVCFIPPLVGTGIALGLFGIAGSSLPLIVLAFGGMLCGSTTDYGIQLIAACNRRRAAGEAWSAETPARVARELLGPISMSVATSVTAFASLGLSASAGLRGMGLFVAAATSCIWAFTFLVLPAYLGPWALAQRASSSRPWRMPRWSRWGAAVVFAVLTLMLLHHAGDVRFNADPRTLDGSSPAARRDEADFYATWGDMSRRAIVLVQDSAPDAALKQLARVTDFLGDQQADGMIGGIISPAALLPDDAGLNAAANRWRQFWTPQRRADLQSLLADAATQNHIKQSWVADITGQLSQVPPIPDAASRIGSSPAAMIPGLMQLSPASTTFAIVVQMNRDASLRMATAWADELRLRYPSSTIISGHALFFDATDRARAEAESFAPCVLLAILLPLWLYFRRVTIAWIATLSLVVGFICVLGVAQAHAGGLTLLSLVPILFTLGVAIDYGIYAASDPSNAGFQKASGEHSAASRSSATFLCAFTTILGVGALALASHPVLHWLGLTLISGITGGFLASQFLVAPLVRRWHGSRQKRHGFPWRFSSLPGRVALVVLVGILAIPPIGQWQMARAKPADAVAIPQRQPEQIDRHTWTTGNAWIRRRGGIWELSAGGTPEEIGAATAALGAPIDVRIEHEMLDQLDTLVPQAWARWLVLRGVAINLLDLPSYTPPDLRREIYASANARPDPYRYLSPTYPRILGYHALHDISQMLIDNPLITAPSGACTGVIALPAATRDSHLLLGRNFDFEGGESFGRQKSVSYIYPAEGIAFATVAWPGLAGCVTGMNQQKIALFINAAATSDFARIGEPTIFVTRDILQHAKTIDEAVAIITRAKVFVSDIIVIADGKTGRAVIVEKSPGATAVRDASPTDVVANHLLSARFKDDPTNQERIAGSTSVSRFNRARELLDAMKSDVTVGQIAALLRDKRGPGGADIGIGNRNAIDALIACHSVIMDVTGGKMWVAAWPHAAGQYVCIDVQAMLATGGQAGRDIPPDSLALPSDPILSDGTYEEFLQSRAAFADAENQLKMGDAAAAAQTARAGVALNPNFFHGHALLGRALLQTGERSAAKVELLRALALDPPYRKTRDELEKLVEQCR